MANYFVKKKLFYQKKNFTEKMYTNMKKKMLLKMDEIYITKTYEKLRSYPNQERVDNYI